ncbi:MAG: PadR family transcriptional regulator [Acidobacteria bacterium]|nr:MAG: PadR family transcriptional regulator [Acidobacteriota bacterium]
MSRTLSRKSDRSPAELLPLSTADFHILLSIADGERHGYGIMQDVRQTTGGTIRLGAGTLYRSIQGLLRENLVEESPRRPADNEDQRRRYYRLSSLGRRVIGAEARRLADAVDLAKVKRVLRRVPI